MKRKDDKQFNASTLLWLRERAGLTQEELGGRVHLCKQSISNYELSVKKPSKKSLKALADYFQIEVGDFYLNDSGFAIKYNAIHPADFGQLIQKAIDHIYVLFEKGEGTEAIHNLAKIKDEIQLASRVFGTPAAIQLQVQQLLREAANMTDDEDADLIDDPDYDPRKP